jgi:hypothetical protein
VADRHSERNLGRLSFVTSKDPINEVHCRSTFGWFINGLSVSPCTYVMYLLGYFLFKIARDGCDGSWRKVVRTDKISHQTFPGQDRCAATARQKAFLFLPPWLRRCWLYARTVPG